MYKPSRQGNGVDILGEKEILEKWQVQRIDQVIDVLGLQGDSVDNIPRHTWHWAKNSRKTIGSIRHDRKPDSTCRRVKR